MAFRFLSQANIHYVSEWFTLNWSVKFLIIRMPYQQKKSSRQNGRQISVDETGRIFLSTKQEENSVDETDQLMTCRPNGTTPLKLPMYLKHVSTNTICFTHVYCSFPCTRECFQVNSIGRPIFPNFLLQILVHVLEYKYMIKYLALAM